MAVVKNDSKKKAVIGIGLAAAGLGALYLLSRGGSGQTTEGELSSFGGFGGGVIGSSEGGLVEPVGSVATQPARDYQTFDYNALFEGINNLNAQQAAQNAALMNRYSELINQTQPTAYNAGQAATQENAEPFTQGGSVSDEIADRYSNPGGSATKKTDLERALEGYDLTAQDLNNIYGHEGVASYSTEGIYQLNPYGEGVLVAGGASNVNQPTGNRTRVTRVKEDGSNSAQPMNASDVITVDKGNTADVYNSSGQYVGTLGGGSGESAISGYKATMQALTGGDYQQKSQANAEERAAYEASYGKLGSSSSGSGTTTARTQSGGTTQVSPSSSQSSTASNTPNVAQQIASNIGGAINTAASTASSIISGIGSFFGGLFK